MHTHPVALSLNAVPLLDEEFDKAEENAASAQSSSAPVHVVLCHDRAWEDQIDEGEEMSLT